MTRRANNLGLMKLRMPVTAVFDPLVFLQQPNNCLQR
jgi:hypothetical protein